MNNLYANQHSLEHAVSDGLFINVVVRRHLCFVLVGFTAQETILFCFRGFYGAMRQFCFVFVVAHHGIFHKAVKIYLSV